MTFTFGPDLSTVRKDIANFFKLLWGYNRVHWSDQMASEIVHPHIELNVISTPRVLGLPDRMLYTASGVNYEITKDIQEMVINIQVHSHPLGKAILTDDSLPIMLKIERGCLTQSALDYLESKGLALVEKSAIMNLDEQEGEYWIKTVSQDYRFRFTAYAQETIDIISHIAASGYYKSENGTTIETQTFNN